MNCEDFDRFWISFKTAYTNSAIYINANFVILFKISDSIGVFVYWRDLFIQLKSWTSLASCEN